MSKFSVKRPFTIFVAVVIVLMLGVVSFTRMTTDLLPQFNIPYVMVITTYPGASPEKVESTVTEPMESQLGKLNGVLNVMSTSSENVSMVTLEFEEDTNMDSAMVKIASAVDLVPLPDEAGSPMMMEMSIDMMATMYVSVAYDGMDIYELTDFVQGVVTPRMERQNGVASVEEMGAVNKSVEIRLLEDEVDALNDKLAAHVNGKLAETKAELDKAQAELDKAKNQMADAKDALNQQQTTTATDLAESSKLVDQAMATQAAYQANLSSLQASKQALEMELAAYEEAKVQESYADINTLFSSLPMLAAIVGEDATKLPSDIKDAIANPDKLTVAVSVVEKASQIPMISSQIPDGTAAFLTVETLTQLDTANTRIPQIGPAIANLETEIMTAEAVLKEVNTQVQAAVDSYTALESGKMAAAAGFGAAQAQIATGESGLTEGQAQLDEGIKAYESARDQALKSANLDQLCSMETLSQLIYAQNFAMPAGYIYEGDSQYLLKVGEEFSDIEQLKDTVLTKVDGIGDIKLSDIAAVTWIDNSQAAYAKVNGEQGVLLSIFKASTAGTSEVSDNCNEAMEALMEEYPGLHISTLMNQGDYIDYIVQSVLSNLVWGAILAVVVLAVFLRSVKPTLVVAFSIPLSVLVAVVLMYFSGVTLNLISLSGLALGVGMLVDNSIVVIENIYRLRGKGIPATRAAIMGAKQVGGAIIASTLTTICVFFPIVFTTGMVKQLFVDMALTITYSLLASLLVALSVVPCMSAGLLKNSEPRKQHFMEKIYGIYEKALRFCLRKKLVPILIAVVLLAVCVLQAVRTGLILLPSMGGEQMSASYTVNEEYTDEQVFELADEIMEELTAIEGVETVGMMSGSDEATASASATSLLSAGGKHNMNIMMLLDEKAAKDNSKIAKQIRAILEDKGTALEDFYVSESNMDMSALLGSGMELVIYGDDQEELIAISEDLMELLGQVEGFENISNGQEEADPVLVVNIDKNAAMRDGLTVAQIYAELAGALSTETTAATLTMDGEQYSVKIIDEIDQVTRDNLMDYTFDVTVMDETGAQTTETRTLSDFATVSDGKALVSINRDNQRTYLSVTAETMDGYNTTLLSREFAELLEGYDVPDGYEIEMSGETTAIEDAMQDVFLMIALAIALIYLIMVAQFQSLLSPFIVIFTIPLAFTGGLLGTYITRQDISLVSMMGFLMLAGVIVNNGIVFVDYVNKLRLAGVSKTEALVRTGKSRMRPILMTTLTTVFAMLIMACSQDAAAEMTRGMAVVVIGGLLYATLMTLFIVPVLYDIFFRRELKNIEVQDKELEEIVDLTVEEL